MILRDFENRVVHWEGVLLATRLPSELAPRVAFILTQDEFYGLNARTPSQLAVMAFAAKSVPARNKLVPVSEVQS